MNEDEMAQKMEALKEIQKRADELERDLDKTPCADIDCAECPARRFCYLAYNNAQWVLKNRRGKQ